MPTPIGYFFAVPIGYYKLNSNYFHDNTIRKIAGCTVQLNYNNNALLLAMLMSVLVMLLLF
jgi:hypothetical protein